jgi:hypothetical protein
MAIGLATIAAALLIVGAVVFGARDAALFVPPPEAVAETFGRALASGRFDVARRHLSDQQRREQRTSDLRARFDPWKTRIGQLNHAKSTELSREGDRASATCELQGAAAVVALSLQFVREQGLWRVERWEVAADVTR